MEITARMPLVTSNNSSWFQDTTVLYLNSASCFTSRGDISKAASFSSSFNKDTIKLSTAFNKMIDSRLIYLDGLSALEANWINGVSESPNIEVINFSKKFLENLRSIFNEMDTYPKIVMGPIPRGGLSFEIYLRTRTMLYISLYNDREVEFEFSTNNSIIEVKSDFDRLIPTIEVLLTNI